MPQCGVEQQVAMNLVRADGQPVTLGHIDQTGEFLGPPSAPDRVMRMAEQQQPRARADSLFQRTEIPAPAIGGIHQWHGLQVSRRLGWSVEERWVYGCCGQYGVPVLPNRPAGEVESRYQTWQPHQPVGLDRPPIVPFRITLNRVNKRIGCVGVAQDPMIDSSMKGCQYGGWAGEVHVCHPERYHVPVAILVPFGAGEGGAYDGAVEIHGTDASA